MHFRCVFTLLLCCVLVGLNWAEPLMYFKFACHVFMHFHAYIPSIFYILLYYVVGAFFIVSLSPFLSFSCVSLHYGTQTQINSILEPSSFWGIFFFLWSHSISRSVPWMRRPVRTSWRTFVDEAFIRNAKSSLYGALVTCPSMIL